MQVKTIDRYVLDPLVDIETESVHKTILFNCSCHEFEEVISQVVEALGCSLHRATHLAVIAHYSGQAIVCTGSEEYCERVSATLREIGLETEVVS